MTFRKPLIFSALACLFALPLASGCAYDDDGHYGRHDDWRRNDWDHDRWDHHDARPAGFRDRDRDGVPDRLEHHGWN